MVVEEGVHVLNDGTVIEAGRSKAAGRWQKVKLSGKFKKSPVVLTQITTQQKANKRYNTRLNYVTNKQFRVKL